MRRVNSVQTDFVNLDQTLGSLELGDLLPIYLNTTYFGGERLCNTIPSALGNILTSELNAGYMPFLLK